MSCSVECVSAEIGLNVRLPQSFSQISARMLSSTGHLRPDATNAAAIASTRGLLLPSSSPSGKRSPSMCTTVPGAVNSVAGYTTQPRMRAAGIAPATRPPGSTDSTMRPASGPPWFWKYQNGMPFCIGMTTVSAW